MGEITVLAADTAENLGRAVGTLAIPVIGLVLLVVGLRKRSASQRASGNPAPQPFPQQGGYPPQGGYAQQSGYPQQYPQAGYPQPRPKKAGTGLVVAGSILLALGLLGGLARVAKVSSDADGIAVGDCITNDTYHEVDLDPDTVNCSDPSAVFELAKRTDSGDGVCPDGERELSQYAVLANSKTTLCFTVNLVEGDCYRVDVDALSFEPSACEPGVGVLRVAKRVDGSADQSLCSPGDRAISFDEPKRVYCIVAA